MIIFKIKDSPFVFMIGRRKKRKTNSGYQNNLNRLGGGYTLMMSNAWLFLILLEDVKLFSWLLFIILKPQICIYFNLLVFDLTGTSKPL